VRTLTSTLLSVALLVTSLVALSTSPARADLTTYRETIEDMESVVDYYPLDGFLEDTLEGANKILNHGVENAALVQYTEEGTGVGGDGQAASFDGATAFTIERSVEESFSILAWIKTDQINIGGPTSQFYQGSGLIYADVGGNNNDFGTAITGTRFAFGIGRPDQTTHSRSEVNTGEWVFVAAVRDVREGGSDLRVYVNGTLESTHAHANPNPLTAQAQISIGGNTIDSRYYQGLIDEVAIFNEPLDDQMISELWSAMTGIEACFSAEPTEGVAPFNVAFDASCSSAEDDEIIAYEWDFGGLATAEGEKVEHEFRSPGVHTVTLTVRTEAGFAAFTTQEIQATFQGDPPERLAPWISTDVGRPSLPGGARLDGDCLVVFGTGDGINRSEPSFHFLHQPHSGDADFSARLEELGWGENAMVGLMMRENLDPDSIFAATLLWNVPARGTRAILMWRTETSGRIRVSGRFVDVAAPDGMLRLERRGFEFVASVSVDGKNWQEIRVQPFEAAPENMLAGMVSTATNDADGQAQAIFCDVSLDGGREVAPTFLRGDTDADGALTLTDGIQTLNFLFSGGTPPSCLDAADTNDEGGINLTDAIHTLNYLFTGGPEPLAPFPSCGPDAQGDTDGVDCLTAHTNCPE